METAYAVIADIVGSRKLPDRASAQAAILEALAQASEGLPLVQRPWATVGDEFQALAATLDDALTLTLRTQLLLPDGVELRFGIGAGQARTLAVDDGAAEPGVPSIQDGSAWWAAREALETLGSPAARQRGARTCYQVAENAPDSVPAQSGVNTMLSLRDHVLGRMKARERRLTAGLAMGQTQVELARAEGIGQSAVSQSLHRCGAIALLQPLTPSPEETR